MLKLVNSSIGAAHRKPDPIHEPMEFSDFEENVEEINDYANREYDNLMMSQLSLASSADDRSFYLTRDKKFPGCPFGSGANKFNIYREPVLHKLPNSEDSSSQSSNNNSPLGILAPPR